MSENRSLPQPVPLIYSCFLIFPAIPIYLATDKAALIQILFAVILFALSTRQRPISNTESIALCFVALLTLINIAIAAWSGTSQRIYFSFLLYFLISWTILRSPVSAKTRSTFQGLVAALGLLATLNVVLMSQVGYIFQLNTPNGREYFIGPFMGISTGDVGGIIRIYRQTGLFEEPGIFGTVLAFTLLSGVKENWKKIGIILGGISSGSIAFIMLLLVSVVVTPGVSLKNLFRILILAILTSGGLLMVSQRFVVLEYAMSYMVSRFTSFLGSNSYGDTRSHLYIEILEYQDLGNSFFFGNTAMLQDDSFGMASLLSIIYVYGLPLMLLTFSTLFYRYKSAGLRPFLLILTCLLQRPMFFEPAFAVVFALYLSNLKKRAQ